MTRQQLRAQLRADALVRVNAAYGPEPRGARRKIARAWAKKEWRKRAALAVSCGVLALTSLGILAQPARAQGSRKDDIVFNAQGHPMAGATVRVCAASASGEPCAPLANIYSDVALSQPMANPMTTDGLGNYSFYAAPGQYEIEISGPNITTKQMPNVILPSAPYSVSGFGARSLNVNLGVATTASCTAFSASVLLASALQFQNGDGVFLPGCGAATTLNTPAAPAITPVALAGPENSGLYVPLTGQSTTYCYQISAEDLGNGHTAASPLGCTTTGDATIGLHAPVSITSCSLSGLIVTCTLASSTTDLPAGTYVHIMGANPAQFDGWFTLLSVSGSTITFEQSQSSNYAGVVTSETGGTLDWHIANLITLPSGTGAQDFIVYGRTTASLAYQCISAHDNSGGYQQLWYMDYGPTESANCYEPSWIPSVPPTSTAADGLVTTIAAGAGTTSITLAAAAGTTTSSGVAQYDNCAQILAAAIAAEGNGGPLYFPPGTWVIGSYCSLPSGITINQAGSIELYNTLDVSGPTRWYAANYASGGLQPSFALAGYGAPTVNVESPYPGVYANGDRAGTNGFFLQGLHIASGFVKDQAVQLLVDDMFGFTIDSTVIQSGIGGNDYLGTTLDIRASGSGGGTFDNSITNSTFADSMGQFDQDQSWAPTILMQAPGSGGGNGSVGDIQMLRINTDTRGGIGYYNNNALSMVLTELHAQGPEVPIIQTSVSFGQFYASNVFLDSSAGSAIFAYTPGIANYDPGTYFAGIVSLDNSYQPGADAYGLPGAISGLPVSSLIFSGPQDNLGQNFSFHNLNPGGLINTLGTTQGSAYLGGGTAPNGPTVVPHGTFAPFAFAQAVPAPTASVSSGGSVPVGNWCVLVAPVFPGGGEGVPGACSNTLNVTSGNQTVNASISSTVPGAISYIWYLQSIPIGSGFGVINGCVNVGTSCTDTYGFFAGDSAPSVAADGYPHFGIDGVRTPQVTTGALTGALVTKSSAYTLTSSDYWVNVTGTTTITAPHAIVGQHWVVFNSGSNTVTVAADSGNINGAASITLSANTGKEIACDGTNCFAH